MDYKEKYNDALEKARILIEKLEVTHIKGFIYHIFPELMESEDDRIKNGLIALLKFGLEDGSAIAPGFNVTKEQALAWLEKQGEPEDKGEISDGYHTFNELYRYRMLYNAAFFNLLPKELVHKSKKHHDGKECFGGGWFIVMANLPTGQISNHYELKDWDLFQIPEKDFADEWDGHTPQEAADRLHKYLLEKQSEQKSTSQMEKCLKCQFVFTGYCNGTCILKNNEQEPVDEAEPKFHIGDKIRIFRKGAANEEPMTITKIDGKGYWSGDLFLCNFTDADRLKLVEQNPVDEVEPKFKVGDIVQYITDSTERRKIEEIDTLCNMYHTDSSPIMFEVEDEWKVVVNAEDVEQESVDKVDFEKKELKKKLDADKVIEWLVGNICDFECYVKRFKQDFEL